MYFHPEAAILPEIEVHIPVCRAGISVGKIKYLNNHRLFVELPELGILRIDNPVEARGKHIVDRFLASIILYTHRTDLKSAVLRLGNTDPLASLHEGEIVFSPLRPDQVKLGKPHYHRIVEIPEEHPHEPYRLEIADDSHAPLIFCNRYPELIPLHLRFGSVCHLDRRFYLINYKVHSHLHIFGPQAYPVLIIALCLIECIVAVYILHVGKSGTGCGIRFGRHL